MKLTYLKDKVETEAKETRNIWPTTDQVQRTHMILPFNSVFLLEKDANFKFNQKLVLSFMLTETNGKVHFSQGSLQCEKQEDNRLVKFKTYIDKLAVCHSTVHFQDIFVLSLPPIEIVVQCIRTLLRR